MSFGDGCFEDNPGISVEAYLHAEIERLRKRVEELERANASLTYENVELRSWTRARESEIIDRGGRNIEAMKRLCAEFKSESAAKDAEIIALRKQVEDMQHEYEQCQIWKREAQKQLEERKRAEAALRECLQHADAMEKELVSIRDLDGYYFSYVTEVVNDYHQWRAER